MGRHFCSSLVHTACAVMGGCSLPFWAVNHPLPQLSSPLFSHRTGAVPQQHWDVLGCLERCSALLLFRAGRAWMQQPHPGAPAPPRTLSWNSHGQVGVACRPAGIMAMPGPVLLRDAWRFRASVQLIRSSQPLFGTKARPCAPSPPSSAASGSEKSCWTKVQTRSEARRGELAFSPAAGGSGALHGTGHRISL